MRIRSILTVAPDALSVSVTTVASPASTSIASMSRENPWPSASISLVVPRGLLFHTAGGLFDQGGNGIGVGDIDSMAARHLNDGGAGPVRHELLCGIRNHLVVADLEIPARLGLPSRLCDRAGEGVDAPRAAKSAAQARRAADWRSGC